MLSVRHLIVLLAVVFLLVGAVFPTPRGFVNDFASVLDPAARQRLEERLAAYERETSNEIAIAIVPSLGGRGIDSAAVALFEEWKIGKRGKDNGILILVAVQERAVRIEVGYGLEGKVTDGQAGRIIRELIVPNFREGRYAKGLEAAIVESIRLIGSPAGPAAVQEPRTTPARVPLVLILGVLAILVIGAVVYSAVAKPRCPKCGRRMRVSSRRRILTARGYREALVYQCPLGHYRELREGPAWQPGGWGTAGPWMSGGGLSGGGGFGGFGGGSSGGGGASGRW